VRQDLQSIVTSLTNSFANNPGQIQMGKAMTLRMRSPVAPQRAAARARADSAQLRATHRPTAKLLNAVLWDR
jgi:hypothetical protein